MSFLFMHYKSYNLLINGTAIRSYIIRIDILKEAILKLKNT